MAPLSTTQKGVLLVCFLATCRLQQVGSLTTIFDPDEDRSVQLFEEEDQEGGSMGLYWHTPALEPRWSSIEQSGVWIYYSEENYTGDNVTVVFGEDVAINIFHPLRSVRYAGNSQSSTLPAVILYRDTWFRGEEYAVELVEGDDLVMVPNFRDFGKDAKSIIIVGSTFAFYENQNFQGPGCWCRRPTHFAMTYGDENEMMMASFYPDLDDMGTVGSFMMTCKMNPMKDYCHKRSDEDKNKSRCPVLTNGRVKYCQE